MLEGDPRFFAILDEMKETHIRKSRDYGADTDPLKNCRASEEFGIPSHIGVAVRMNDKMQRIKSFAKKGSLANESLEDAYLDLASYAILALILYREGKP